MFNCPANQHHADPEDVLERAYSQAPLGNDGRFTLRLPSAYNSDSEEEECQSSGTQSPHVGFAREPATEFTPDQSSSEDSQPAGSPSDIKMIDEPMDFVTAVEDPVADDIVIEAAIIGNEPSGSLRFPNWFITVFTENFAPDFHNWSDVIFAVYTKEIAPTTGNVHYHCYIELKREFSRDNIKAALKLPNCDIQPRKGTQKQAIIYCTKQRTRFPDFVPVFYGRPKCPGYRSDLDWLVEAVIQGATVPEIIRMGGGNAMRYVGMIRSTQDAFLGNNKNDIIALYRRQIASIQGIPLNRVPAFRYDEIDTELVERLRNGIVTDEIEKNFGDMSDELRRSLLMLSPASRNEQVKLDKKQGAAKPAKKEKPINVFKGLKSYKKLSQLNIDRVKSNLRISVLEYLKTDAGSTIQQQADKIAYSEHSSREDYNLFAESVLETIEEYVAEYAARSFPDHMKEEIESVIVQLLEDDFIDFVIQQMD